MIRSFSLIMAGVMLRVWVPIYYALAAAGIVDFSFETAYAAIAWLCWVRTCCSPSGSPATQPKSRMQGKSAGRAGLIRRGVSRDRPSTLAGCRTAPLALLTLSWRSACVATQGLWPCSQSGARRSWWRP